MNAFSRERVGTCVVRGSMRWLMGRIALMSLFGWSLCACRSPSVAPEKLVGTWVVSRESRHILSSAPPRMTLPPDASMSLTLKPDGMFSASQVPGGLLYAAPGDDRALVSGSGVWTLAHERGEQNVRLEFRSIEIDGRRGTAPFVTSLLIAGNRRIALFYYHGDPDSGARVRFEKVQ